MTKIDAPITRETWLLASFRKPAILPRMLWVCSPIDTLVSSAIVPPTKTKRSAALGPPVKRFAGEYSGNGYKSKFKALVSRNVEKLIDRDAAFRKPLCVMLV